MKSIFDKWYDDNYQKNLRHHDSYWKCKQSWLAAQKQQIDEILELKKQRDDMLAALEKIAKHYEDKCGLDATPSKRAEAWRLDYHNVKGIAINAIASVKGSAA